MILIRGAILMTALFFLHPYCTTNTKLQTTLLKPYLLLHTFHISVYHFHLAD